MVRQRLVTSHPSQLITAHTAATATTHMMHQQHGHQVYCCTPTPALPLPLPHMQLTWAALCDRRINAWPRQRRDSDSGATPVCRSTTPCINKQRPCMSWRSMHVGCACCGCTGLAVGGPPRWLLGAPAQPTSPSHAGGDPSQNQRAQSATSNSDGVRPRITAAWMIGAISCTGYIGSAWQRVTCRRLRVFSPALCYGPD